MYKKVLVPLDGSKLAESALDHVKTLFKDGAIGEVTILHVVKIDVHWSELEGGHFSINAVRDALFSAAKKYLAGVESQLASGGIKVQTILLEGSRPAETILDYAQKNGMEMVIIATHGYTGLRKLMFGSVAYGVLHESHIPVLLIRPKS